MATSKTLKEILKSSKKALLIGIGGGGDIVGTIPTSELLRIFGIECLYGGIAWERSVFDPEPGPRTFEETKNVRKLNEVVWYANPQSATYTDVSFAESSFSKVLGQETFLIDIHKGPKAVSEGIYQGCLTLGVDLVVGIDVGGDVLAQGGEPGLMSPLADSVMTASMYYLDHKIPTFMGLFGYGSDGELTHDELESSMKILAREGGILGSWGITFEALKRLEDMIAEVPTEASRMPVLFAKGEPYETNIRSGLRKVSLTMSSTATFYFSTKILYEKLSKLSPSVCSCATLEEANDALHLLGVHTELDIERERKKAAQKQ